MTITTMTITTIAVAAKETSSKRALSKADFQEFGGLTVNIGFCYRHKANLFWGKCVPGYAGTAVSVREFRHSPKITK